MSESRLILRCIKLKNGDTTSVKLEPEFWEILDRICTKLDKTLATVVQEIDAIRGDSQRTSAIRVFILNHFCSEEASVCTIRTTDRPHDSPHKNIASLHRVQGSIEPWLLVDESGKRHPF